MANAKVSKVQKLHSKKKDMDYFVVWFSFNSCPAVGMKTVVFDTPPQAGEDITIDIEPDYNCNAKIVIK